MMKPKFQSWPARRSRTTASTRSSLDESTSGHRAAHLGAQFGVLLHVPAEDVADADVDQVEVVGEQLGLGALAAALHAHDHVFPHVGHHASRRTARVRGGRRRTLYPRLRMFLKTLTLKGFKSFADATVLDLEPGITVVVGPNGSGKSNVVDAIGWVLGAQAPSAVRSQKMDDVIFAGTAKRPALGRAEVSLTIDNSAGLLPIEFTEVTITRTLFRTGESEYAINGAPCRLLDIQELLCDTGVGRQQHVIISQGQIDAVLNARPEERRLVIEEAAGVLKYRRRKEKAERKLQATEGNLTRLHDLLREVRRQLRPLERQADAARRHGDLVAELRHLRRFQAGRELTTLRSRLEVSAATRRELAEEERALKASLAQLDTAVVATEAELSSMGADDVSRGPRAHRAGRRAGPRPRRRAHRAAPIHRPRARRQRRRRRDRLPRGRVGPPRHRAGRRRGRRRAPRPRRRAPGRRGGRPGRGAGRATPPSGRRSWRPAACRRRPAPPPRSAASSPPCGRASSGAAAERQRVDERVDAARGQGWPGSPTRPTGSGPRPPRPRPPSGPWPTRSPPPSRARAAAERQLAAAEERLRAADAERHSWSARADALALALDAARARAGAEHLAGVDGVLGTLLDLVEVDDGWEAAFEAAAGEALAAVVVESADAGRAALGHLRAGEVPGAVLALGARPTQGIPLVPVGRRAAPRTTCAGLQPGVDELLDALVGHAVLVEADGAGKRPSTSPSPTPTPSSSPRPATASASPAGGSAGRPPAPPAPPSTRPASGRPRPTAGGRRRRARGAALRAARRRRHHRRRPSSPAQLNENDGRFVAATDAIQRVEADRRDAATELETLRGHGAELAERAGRDAGPGRRARGPPPAARGRRARRRRAGPGHGRRPQPARGAGRRRRRPAGRPRGAGRHPRGAAGVPPHAGRPRSRSGSRATSPSGRPPSPGGSSSTPRPPPSTAWPPSSPPASASVEAGLAELRERRRRQSRGRPGRRRPPRRAPQAAGRRRAHARGDRASGPAGPRSTRPRPGCGSRPPSRCAGGELDCEPARRHGHRGPRAARGRHARRPPARARARAAAHGADQPAGPPGVRGAAGAPRVPRGPARRREVHPARPRRR